MVRMFLKFAAFLLISSSLNATVVLQIDGMERVEISKLKVVKLPGKNFAMTASTPKKRWGLAGKKYDIYFTGAKKEEIKALILRCEQHLKGGAKIVIFASRNTERISGDLTLGELPQYPYLGLQITEDGLPVQIVSLK